MSFGGQYNLNQRVTYLESLINGLTPFLPLNLENVLLAGNSAGATDINLNNNQLLNCSEITSSGDLILNPIGNVNTNGNTFDLNNGEIHQCPLLQGINNTNINVEGRGTGDVILKTGATNRLTIDDTGFFNFDGGMTYDNGTNTLSATNFTGLVSNATNCVNTTNLNVTVDNTTGAYPITFAKSNVTGQQPLFIGDLAPLTYNPFSGVMDFSQPPTCAVSATTTSQSVNFDNFTPTSYIPTLTGASGAPIYAIQKGTFTKINNLCFCQIDIQISAIDTLTGDILIVLPIPSLNPTSSTSFAISNVGGLAAAGGLDLTASTTGLNLTVASSLRLDIRATLTSTASAQLNVTNITNNFRISLAGSYFVNT